MQGNAFFACALFVYRHFSWTHIAKTHYIHATSTRTVTGNTAETKRKKPHRKYTHNHILRASRMCDFFRALCESQTFPCCLILAYTCYLGIVYFISERSSYQIIEMAKWKGSRQLAWRPKGRDAERLARLGDRPIAEGFRWETATLLMLISFHILNPLHPFLNIINISLVPLGCSLFTTSSCIYSLLYYLRLFLLLLLLLLLPLSLSSYVCAMRACNNTVHRFNKKNGIYLLYRINMEGHFIWWACGAKRIRSSPQVYYIQCIVRIVCNSKTYHVLRIHTHNLRIIFV